MQFYEKFIRNSHYGFVIELLTLKNFHVFLFSDDNFYYEIIGFEIICEIGGSDVLLNCQKFKFLSNSIIFDNVDINIILSN